LKYQQSTVYIVRLCRCKSTVNQRLGGN